MAGVAYGLWQRSYGVILLFQALLALTIIVFTLSLAFASNLLAVLLCVVGIARLRADLLAARARHGAAAGAAR